MILGLRLIQFLFTWCLVRKQPEMFLKYVSEILCIIPYEGLINIQCFITCNK